MKKVPIDYNNPTIETFYGRQTLDKPAKIIPHNNNANNNKANKLIPCKVCFKFR